MKIILQVCIADITSTDFASIFLKNKRRFDDNSGRFFDQTNLKSIT